MTAFLVGSGVAAFVVIPWAVNRWISSRSEIDDYYEREHRDPAAFGTTSSPSGGGF